MFHIKRCCALILFFGFAVNAFCQGSFKKITEELVVEAPPFNQCHASTIVELKSGKILIAWFGGKHEGNSDVVIWMSTREKNRWSKPKPIADGIVHDSLRFPTWNPVLFQEKSGRVFLFYKVGPNPREWWGMLKTSTDEGKTWSKPERLPKGLLGPIKNKPLQLRDGSILSPSSTESETRWNAHIERSSDNGKTWSYIPIDTAGSYDVIQPSIVSFADGRLEVLCRSKQGFVMKASSYDNGKTWSKLTPTSLINPNAGTDAVTLNNGWQLIVYNPDVPGKEWWNGRSKLHVALSSDGNDWKDALVLENADRGEFSYPAVIQTRDGRVHISYTFDRKNIKYVVLESVK